MKFDTIAYFLFWFIGFASANASQQAESKHCEVYLIRHGQTDWNKAGRIQGQTDIPLNENGILQARELAEKLKVVSFAAFYSSDLSRARQTASIVAGRPESEIATHAHLRERRMGCFEGRAMGDSDVAMMLKDMVANENSRDAFLSWSPHEDAESATEVYTRLELFLRELVKVHQGRTVLVSSHAGVLSALLYYLDFREGYHWQISNCAQIKLRIEEEKISILEMAGIKLADEW